MVFPVFPVDLVDMVAEEVLENPAMLLSIFAKVFEMTFALAVLCSCSLLVWCHCSVNFY